jgi:hypothetical protein
MHSFVTIQRMTSKQNPLINLFIDAILETTEIERDFVFIASNLTWNKQINHKWEIFTWNKLLGYTRRNTRFIENTAVRSILYLALVCAHLGHAKKNLGPTINRTDNPTGTNKDEWDQIYSQLAIFLWYGLQHARGCITYSFILICYWHEYFNRPRG